jgi:threonine dehydrogenase-like Zn-dependent dehydrogenase
VLFVASTAICGPDLHLYHGTIPGVKHGQTLAHKLWRGL